MTSADPAEAPRPGLRDLDLPPGFDSSDDILASFYVPVLGRAVHYDRSVGYFRSSALAVAARGLSRFINGGGIVRLLAGAEITPADRDALIGRTTLDGPLADRLAHQLVTADEVAARRLEVLAWLAQQGRLEVRIAIAVDADGAPRVGGAHAPYFHEKIGVLRDARGDGIAFQGSVNESETAWTSNFESFSVYESWGATAAHFSFWTNKFEQHWSGALTGFRVYPLPEAVRRQLIALAPNEPPSPRDPEEPPMLGDDSTVARFLAAAPRLAGATGLAEATTGVTLYPHQRQVVARLADLYPRSWLVADEVGLGKTISAGMALRRLLLAGEVERVLILAPASVCRQWQDELFEKFGLWVPRLDGGRVYGVHPDDVTTVPTGQNPFAQHPLLIASSHLARRPEYQRRLLDAAPYDLLVVDEAHHARRQHLNDPRYRPSRLLQLLDAVQQQDAAHAVWLLTATPMQISPVELTDLTRLVGLSGPLTNPDHFQRYFGELAKDDEAATDWAWLHAALQATPRLPLCPADAAVLARIQAQLGPVQADRIARFGVGEAAAVDTLLADLGREGRQCLRVWLRTVSPVGQYVTRHSRETLKQYRASGLIDDNLADRDVEPVLIPFSAEEQALYDGLDTLIDRLMAAHGSRRGAGFVLTVYRRRLTSSWAAIQRTLTKRLSAEQTDWEDDLLEEAEEFASEALADNGHGGVVDEAQAVPLTANELAEIQHYADLMGTVPDSKLDRLRSDLDEARSAGHSTIVFTQYTDTLAYLRDSLGPLYRSQLATFTGDGGRTFREADGWVPIAKRDLVEAVRAGQVTVLLATDSASEGLNLQAASYLINYDMPWNPMRVEQRIGRIDRLGQVRDVVHIRHYFIPGTVEESVYNALAGRIDAIGGLLGSLQPILGATEEAFKTIFRAARSERRVVQDTVIGNLLNRVDDLKRSGLEVSVEDSWPIPDAGLAPVTLHQLRDVVQNRFDETLDEPGRAATWDPTRASRDAEGWAALATYGHPKLPEVLDRHGARQHSDHSAAIFAGDNPIIAVRADRSPPERLTALDQVATLDEPLARGEAETLARRWAAKAAQARHDRHLAITRLRQVQWEDEIRGRFIDLVHSVIAGGCAAARYEGADADPHAIWLGLRQDETGGLRYAEAFQERLDIPFANLAPAELAFRREPLPRDQWAEEQRNLGQQLLAMMAEYQRHHTR